MPQLNYERTKKYIYLKDSNGIQIVVFWKTRGTPKYFPTVNKQLLQRNT